MEKLKAMQTAVTVTPSAVLDRNFSNWGVMPVGIYKGAAAFYDLDKQVNQPLVSAEAKYILGILDGRKEDVDLQTLVLPSGAAAPDNVVAVFEVPAGEVWFINSIVATSPADNVGRAMLNWQCSLWADYATTPDAAGLPFYAAAVGAVGGLTSTAYFGANVLYTVAKGIPELLRLPAGATITVTATAAVGILGADLTSTVKLYGYRGKALVA
jgi:hypothetical protein